MNEEGLRGALVRAWPALLLAALASAPWLASPMFLDDWHLLWTASQAPWTWAGLRDGFTFLDPTSISTWNLPVTPAYHYFRPLVVASFKLDLALWGISPVGFHLTNLVMHGVTIVLVGQLALLLTGNPRQARIAAMVFAILPHNAVAICWTAGRTATMSVMWMTAALVSYITARRDQRPLLHVAALFFAGLACLTKESAVLVGALAAAWELIHGAGPLRTRLKTSTLALLPLGLLLGAFAAWRLLAWDPQGILVEPYFTSPTAPGFGAFALAKLTHYAAAILTMAPVVPIFGTDFLLRHPALMGAVILVTVVVVMLVHRAGAGQRSRWLGGVWLAVAFLPTLPILASDLYPYFPGIGLALVLAAALAPPTRGRKVALWILLALFLVGFSGRGLLYHVQGVADRTAVEDIEADFHGPLPEGAQLVLVNLPVAASHLASHLRLRAGHGDIHATLATISPEWVIPSSGPAVTCEANRVIIAPPPGHDRLFATPEEWNIHLFRTPLVKGKVYRSPQGFTATPRWQGDGVDRLRLDFDGPGDRMRFRIYSFFDRDDGHLAHRVCGP